MVETTTQASILRQAPFLEEFQRRLLDQAFLRGETPVDVPGLFGQAATQAGGTGQTFVPTAQGLQPYLDPYQQQVTQEALGEYQRQADIQRNQLGAQAVQAGAFGGDRFGIQGAEFRIDSL